MNETEAINDKFATFLEDFKDLEEYIQTLLKGNSLEDLSDKLSLIEYSKLNVGLAYLLNSLYYMYMKANGIPFEEHQINTEMDRIKKYVQKIQEVVLVQEDQRKNPLMVDQAAAERMIRAHLHDSMAQEAEEGVGGVAESDPQMVIEVKGDGEAGNKDKSDLYELDEYEAAELEKNQPNATKKTKKLHKGSLLPSGSHLSWKDQIEKMLK